jgi:glycosidase
VLSALNETEIKAKAGAFMYLTGPGIPFVYYGEEIGMTGVKPDEDIRRPMQWTGDSPAVGFTSGTPWRPAADDYPTVNVAAQTDDPNSLFSLYRELISLRNTHPALRTGHTTVIETGSRSVYALLRYNDGDTFLVLVNVDSQPVSDYNLEIESGASNALTLLGLPNPSPLSASGWRPFAELPARSFAILQLKQ